MRGGHLLIMRFRGVPVFAHWSLLLGLLFFTGGFNIGAWIGFFIIILAHEAGHAVLAMRYGFHVYSIEMHGFGGVCRYEGGGTRFHHAVIAWGGVLAQAALYGIARLLVAMEQVQPGIGGDMIGMFLGVNTVIMVVNLIPLPFLDGGQAWSLIPMLLRRGGYSARPRRKSNWHYREDKRPRGGASPVSMDEYRRKRSGESSDSENHDDYDKNRLN